MYKKEWQKILENSPESLKYKELLELICEEDVIINYFPFTQLFSIRLSKNSKYPFETEGMPVITEFNHLYSLPLKGRENIKKKNHDNVYVISNSKMEIIGYGDAKTTVEILKSILE
ncbi:hypothetical protein [Aureivirga sp. CE67]|uniref:hypothetical protein n=1 Tax=Aureivirga sp. CE67 TaxID=1788983 RepID=UPI0018CA076C|nr:hypothetical protein [Aureivirga sp. CE67]